jgi:hypothetical protein
MHTERNGKWAAANAQAELPRTGITRALYETELFLRSYTSTVFFVGFTALTIYHLIASEPWYQYIAMTTALVVGSLLTRARRLKLFEGKIVTETVADEVLLHRAKGDIWSAGFKHGYQSAIAISTPVVHQSEEPIVEIAPVPEGAAEPVVRPSTRGNGRRTVNARG